MPTVPLDVAQRMNPRPPSIIMRPSNMKRTRSYFHTGSRPHYNPPSAIDPSSSRIHPQQVEQVQQNQVKDNQSRFYNAISTINNDPVEQKVEDDYKEYIDWVNQHVCHPIQSIQEIRTGEPLAQLLESICKKPLHRPDNSKPKSASMQMLDIIVASFAYMGREGIRIKGKFTIKGNVTFRMKLL